MKSEIKKEDYVSKKVEGIGEVLVYKENDHFVFFLNGEYVSPFEILSTATDMDNKNAWKAIHFADNLASSNDKTYWNLRHAVCCSIAFDKIEERSCKKNDKIYTYLMKDDNTGLTKIGKSNNPSLREKTLQSEKPTIRLIYICEQLVERELHKKYKNKRVRGEWFNLLDHDIDNIISSFNFKKI